MTVQLCSWNDGGWLHNPEPRKHRNVKCFLITKWRNFINAVIVVSLNAFPLSSPRVNFHQIIINLMFSAWIVSIPHYRKKIAWLVHGHFCVDWSALACTQMTSPCVNLEYFTMLVDYWYGDASSMEPIKGGQHHTTDSFTEFHGTLYVYGCGIGKHDFSSKWFCSYIIHYSANYSVYVIDSAPFPSPRQGVSKKIMCNIWCSIQGSWILYKHWYWPHLNQGFFFFDGCGCFCVQIFALRC